MADFIEEAAIPVSMVGLLCALPNTQLTRRLLSERRLYEGYDFHPDGTGDQCIRLNFETLRPRRDILDDYCRVLSQIYDPVAYCARVERLIGMLRVGVTDQAFPPDHFRRRHGVETVQRIVNRFPEYRDVLWRTFLRCYESNPQAVRQTVILLSFFLHLGPYAGRIVAETRRAVMAIDAGEAVAPHIFAGAHAKPNPQMAAV